jgi:SAM-dependent methyltransferase
MDQAGCPVCAECNWRVIGDSTYRLIDLPRLSEYVRLRYRVLFEVWFPKAQEVQLAWRLCQHCGFVAYAPRPDAGDIQAKYEFLESQGVTGSGGDGLSPFDARRAQQLYRTLARYIPSGGGRRVLDFGGGDGRLMAGLLAAGCDCLLVDYSERVQPGVKKIGRTQEDIPPGDTFDLVVCSHVIEHLAEPVQVVRALGSRLSTDAVLYVEVPLEVWGGPPQPEDPVTHVNFFTPSSLDRAFFEAGLRTISVRVGSYVTADGRELVAVKGLDRRGALGPRHSSARAVRETERLLKPDLLMKLRRNMASPSAAWKAVKYRFRRLISPASEVDGRSADDRGKARS